MRLTLRFLIAAVIPVSLIILGNGYLRLEREVRLLTDEVAVHQRAVGQSLAVVVSQVWPTAGHEGVRALLAEVEANEQLITLRWLPGPLTPGAGLVAEEASRLAAGDVVVQGRARADHRLRSLVPVRNEQGALLGVMELEEQLDREDAYLEETLWLVGRQTLFAAVAVALVMVLVGWAFVARRVQGLVERVREIEGAAECPKAARQGGDELDQLGDEIDAMQARLQEARAALDAETHRRVSTVEQLRHADRLSTVGRLASGIAHELGTPLNVIIGRAQMIEGGVATDKASDYAAVIVRQGQRMSGIVRQLLDFSRRKAPQARAAELSALVEQATGLLVPAAKKRGVHMELKLAPAEAAVDPLQIDQVVTNLVMNAIHACDEGDTITVLTDDDPTIGPDGHRWARLQVRDTGPGMTQEVLEQAFDPFFTTKDVGEGTGLGLAVAHGIVTDHGGTISATSTPGQGTTFTVRLPRATSAPPQAVLEHA